MSLRAQKKSEVKYHLDAEEYIPYAAHYDEETVITKNGELMQVIKVTGFEFETLGSEKQNHTSLRNLVREALKSAIKTENFSVWIHTMRRERDISTGGIHNNYFSSQLHENWVSKNKWRNQFVNELYITILIEGEELSIKNFRHFFESIFIDKEVSTRKAILAENARKLEEATTSVLQSLRNFGARRLSIFKRDGIYYSEIMGFVSKIMNLKQEDIPFGAADLSTILPTHKVEFQYNIVQVEGATGRHFGAVFTVKEFHEVMLAEIDKFLQLPVHFIVSECFDFINKDKALEPFTAQKKIFDVASSKTMLEVSGLQEMLDADTGSQTDYGEHSIVITVLEDSIKGLSRSVSQTVDALRDIGVVFIREDLLMENCYWSMMPGNFDFIKRQSNIPFHKIGGYASLYNFPAGKLGDNLWGDAVTVFRTRNNTPYFFNFHYGMTGHTIVTGEEHSGKTVLINFLVSESQKYKGRTLYFEKGRCSEVFINALEGKYRDISELPHDKITDNVAGFTFADQPVTGDIFNRVLDVVEVSLDERPTIIVLNNILPEGEAQDVVSARLQQWLQKLTSMNALVIIAAEPPKEGSIHDPKLMELFETKIFIADENAGEAYTASFGLERNEISALKTMEKKAREFLLRRGPDSVMARMDLGGIEEMAVLSSDDKARQVFAAVKTEASPETWLKQFYGNLKA